MNNRRFPRSARAARAKQQMREDITRVGGSRVHVRDLADPIADPLDAIGVIIQDPSHPADLTKRRASIEQLMLHAHARNDDAPTINLTLPDVRMLDRGDGTFTLFFSEHDEHDDATKLAAVTWTRSIVENVIGQMQKLLGRREGEI